MERIIHFNDPEFEKYIRQYLGKTTGGITERDMIQIQYLDLGFIRFSDISPIVYCKNLKKVDFAEDFSNTYDLQILKDIMNLKSISVFNPKSNELTELYQYIKFTSLDIIYWGNADICDLNPYNEIQKLSILNFTGKVFSCKNIQDLTELKYLRLGSHDVTDEDILESFPKLEIYKNQEVNYERKQIR